jgi:hypothetical protein
MSRSLFYGLYLSLTSAVSKRRLFTAVTDNFMKKNDINSSYKYLWPLLSRTLQQVIIPS